jgi:DNA repair protein RadA
VELKTAQEIQELRSSRIQHFSTFSSSLDSILGGGIPTDAITAVAGEFGVGKTQLAHQLILSCIKAGRKAVYIETEPSTFSPERLLQMARAAEVKLDLSKDVLAIPANFIPDPARQYLAYVRVDKYCQEGNDVGLLVVDSFSAKFRQYYQKREQLPDRAREEARHLGFLQYLASRYNMAILVTIQVMGIPDTSAQLVSKVKVGESKMPVGGDVMLHGATHWLFLSHVKSKLWKAELFDSPYLPRAEAFFVITEEGIRDYRA